MFKTMANQRLIASVLLLAASAAALFLVRPAIPYPTRLVIIWSIVAALGLATGRVFGLWLARALAATILLDAFIDSLLALLLSASAPINQLWLSLGAAALLALLSGEKLRTDLLSKRPQTAVWTSSHRGISIVRWALLFNSMAVLKLASYVYIDFVSTCCLCRPVTCALPVPTAFLALVFAAIIALGTGILMAQRALGSLVLAIGGVGLVVFMGSVIVLADPNWSLWVMTRHAVVWVLAAIFAIACPFVLTSDHVKEPTAADLPPIA
jgi:hypothetical protein